MCSFLHSYLSIFLFLVIFIPFFLSFLRACSIHSWVTHTHSGSTSALYYSGMVGMVLLGLMWSYVEGMFQGDTLFLHIYRNKGSFTSHTTWTQCEKDWPSYSSMSAGVTRDQLPVVRFEPVHVGEISFFETVLFISGRISNNNTCSLVSLTIQ